MLTSDTRSPFGREKIWPILVVPLVLTWLAGQALWWNTYRFPYGAQIAYEAARFGQSISHSQWSDVAAHIRNCTYYPPLYELTLGFVHAFFGFALGNAIFFNSLLCLLGALAIFLLVRKQSDSFGASIAVLLFLGHGMVFALARIPVREMAITTTTAWLLWSLTNRKLLWHPVYAVLFGALFAAGMLVKWTFPLYSLVPSAAVLLWLTVDGVRSNERARWRAPVMLLVVVITAALLMAPWYLGVLDLKYLAASTANDPTPGSALYRMLFYLNVLGTGSVFGVSSTFVLLGLTLPALLSRPRAAAVPALSLYSGLLLLFIIVHKEERYVLGSIPGMIALVGISFGMLLRHWFVRAPFFLLIAGLAAFNYVHLSFLVPKLPQASGSIDAIPSAACLRTSRDTMRRILDLSANEARRLGRQAVLAWHPLNRNVMTSDRDLFQLAVWDRKLDRQIFFAGYDLVEYTKFTKDLGSIDVLVVADNVWNGSEREIQELMKAWLNFRDANWEKKSEIPAEPRHRAEIEAQFTESFRVDSGCFPAVYVYVRK